MSELSEKYAVCGGNRRKFCLKIGMYITGCILEKTCETCKEEESVNKRSKNPRNIREKDSKVAGIVQGNSINNDQKGPEKQSNGPGNRPIDIQTLGKESQTTDNLRSGRRRRLKSGVK